MFVYRLLIVAGIAPAIMYVGHLPHLGTALWNVQILIFILAHTPFLYAYIFDLLRPGSVKLSFWIASFLPLAFFVALLIPMIAIRGGLPVFTRYAEMSAYTGEPELWLRFAAGLAYITLIAVYTVLSVRKLKRYTRNLPDYFSYTEGVSMRWVYWTLAITVIFAVTVVMVLAIEQYSGTLLNLSVMTVETIITTVFVIRQKDLYRELSDPQEADSNCNANNNDDDVGLAKPPKTGHAALMPERHEQLKNDLYALLTKENIYKDPNINSEAVCDLLHTNRTYLWELINKDMGTTFYQLINNYRLNHAIALMKDPKYRHLRLKDIADLCGFKNADAFGRFFKQTHGKSPTEWRETI
jgi:AraC-like DNA-binding protein